MADLNNVNMFDHIKDPSKEVTVQACLHALKVLPYVADNIVEILVSCLDNEKLFRGSVKHSLNRVRNLINNAVDEASKQSEKMNKEEGRDGDYRIFECDISDKLSSDIIQYLARIVDVATVEGNFLDKIATRAIFMFQLEPGDQFIFLDEGAYLEYTYLGLDEIPSNETGKELVARYCKRNYVGLGGQPVPQFTELNIYRAVMRTTMINEINKENGKDIIHQGTTSEGDKSSTEVTNPND